MSARFIQVHTLTNYAATLLNRDDAGFAKRMPFGGTTRTRISSQCLKRHWRIYDGEGSLAGIEAPKSVRSRVAFDRFVLRPLVEGGVDESVARMAVGTLVGELFGSTAKKEKAAASRKKAGEATRESDATGSAGTAQVTIVGEPELEYLRELARTVIAAGPPNKVAERMQKALQDRDLRKNIQALRPGTLGAGLGAALFGRMVTGDILSRTDAAIHVAHAMTVHTQMSESDYFSAIDDLVRDEGEQASGHINSAELTSGLFYGYAVVDIPGLISNLGGEEALAREVVKRLVHIIATVSPGAKKGSTAPYAYSHLVMVEAGRAQPRTLQNAFIEPVKTSGNLVHNAYAAMKQHLGDLDTMYGRAEERNHAGLGADSYFGKSLSLAELADWTQGRVTA